MWVEYCMNSLRLKSGGNFSYHFNVMISSAEKVTLFEFYLMQLTHFPLLSTGTDTVWDHSCVTVSFSLLFGECHFNTHAAVCYELLCPEAVNEMLKWATCQNRHKSERQALSFWKPEKTDYTRQRCHTSYSSRATENNNENKILSLITGISIMNIRLMIMHGYA